LASPYYFESTVYWSEGDERAHFEWLERIPAVDAVRGEGSRLYLSLHEGPLSNNDLRELHAVYRRFGGDRSQLPSLETEGEPA